MKFNDEFKTRMLLCRSQIGITQSELASIIGVAQRMIAAYELGESRPRMNVLLKLSEVFGVSPEWLAGGKDDDESKVQESSKRTFTIPVLKPGFALKHINNTLDSLYINEFVSLSFEVGLRAFAIKMEDDSMTSSGANEHSFPRGSIVILDPSISAKGGDYTLVIIHGNTPKIAFRKFFPSLDTVNFTPLNVNYPSDSFSQINLREQSIPVIPAVGMIATLPALERVKTLENIRTEEDRNRRQFISKGKN